VCEAPNNAVDKFHGALLWSGQSYSLDIGHLLLRGCTLRNTCWCYGLVVFAGRDSKLLMNDTAPPSFIKQGHLDKMIDQLVIWVCCVSLQQSALCIKNINIVLLLLDSSSFHRVLLMHGTNKYLPSDMYFSSFRSCKCQLYKLDCLCLWVLSLHFSVSIETLFTMNE